MKFLADVNVVFPLLVSRHSHREKAVEWFDRGCLKFTGLDFLLLGPDPAK